MNKYKPSHMVEWESSPLYHVRNYRKPETLAANDVLDEFLDFYRDEYETKNEQGDYEYPSDADIEKLRTAIKAYLKMDMDKIKAGELEMLQSWKDGIGLKV